MLNPVLFLEEALLNEILQIVGTNPEEKQKMHGRHFGDEDEFINRISRKSIDVLKANYQVTTTY